MEDRKYRVEILQYTVNQRIKGNCNAISFINISAATDVYVNNHLLIPNDSLSINGNIYEIDVTEYFIDFKTATNGIIEVIKKINDK